MLGVDLETKLLISEVIKELATMELGFGFFFDAWLTDYENLYTQHPLTEHDTRPNTDKQKS